MKPQIAALMLGVAGLAMLTACETSAPGGDAYQGAPPPPPPPPPPPAAMMMYSPAAPAMERGMMVKDVAPVDRERYEDVEVNPVKVVADEPVSTFSIDVDTTSYANVRRFLMDGILPPKDAVRIEELINYFDYSYPLPEGEAEPFATHVSIAPSPWADGKQLMQVGVQGYDIEPEDRPPLNLTLLVDVSGSMSAPDKLPLAKQALSMLIDQMDRDDRVSIVVYAGAAGEILPPTRGSDKRKILSALDSLSAGGSTAGGEGLRLAYSLAEKGFIEDGVNRVMLLTDGDFNVGIADPEKLEDFVSRQRDTGIYLSVLGFGTGNYNDLMMQKIAQAGNGMASYVDTVNEARKVLRDDLSSNLFPIADDVKIQVEFNPARVAEYRLIGYETRMLETADFNNDKVDAGEIGAGASVTAIYEITPVGSDATLVDPLRYQPATTPVTDDPGGEFAFVKLRYKRPGGDTSALMTYPVTDADVVTRMTSAPEWARWAAAVAGYGQLLRGDPYTGEGFGYDDVIALAQSARGEDTFGYRAEFVQLVRAADAAADQAALRSGSVGE